MKLSRRDVFKLGGLAAVGAAGLAIPLGHTVNGASASLLSAAKMPKPYQSTFGRLEVQSPYRTEVDAQGPVAYYDVSAKTGAVGMVPGMLTPVLGYNGLVPAKRIDVEQGTRIVMTMHRCRYFAMPARNRHSARCSARRGTAAAGRIRRRDHIVGHGVRRQRP
jgi:spore coat protein A